MNDKTYLSPGPERSEIDRTSGPLVLEFGTAWCGFCVGAQPAIEEALRGHPELTRLRIEDGPGRPLGRSFRVKLWPTLIFLKDGLEVARVVRPECSQDLAGALELIAAG
jgi:thioredoxin 1